MIDGSLHMQSAGMRDIWTVLKEEYLKILTFLYLELESPGGHLGFPLGNQRNTCYTYKWFYQLLHFVILLVIYQ